MFIPYPPVLNYVCLRANCSMPSVRTSVFGSLNIGALCLLLSAGKNNYYNYLDSVVFQNISLYIYFSKLCGK